MGVGANGREEQAVEAMGGRSKRLKQGVGGASVNKGWEEQAVEARGGRSKRLKQGVGGASG